MFETWGIELSNGGLDFGGKEQRRGRGKDEFGAKDSGWIRV